MAKAIAIALLAALAGASSAEAANVLYYTSSPTHPVWQGETQTFTPGQGFQFTSLWYEETKTTTTRILNSANIYDYWMLTIRAAPPADLQAGYYYRAQSFGGFPTAIFDFYANLRDGFGEPLGDFHVFQINTSGGAVSNLAVDFLEYYDNLPGVWAWGSLRVNSDIPITPIPEPSTSLLTVAAIAIASIRRRKSVPHNRS